MKWSHFFSFRGCYNQISHILCNLLYFFMPESGNPSYNSYQFNAKLRSIKKRLCFFVCLLVCSEMDNNIIIIIGFYFLIPCSKCFAYQSIVCAMRFPFDPISKFQNINHRNTCRTTKHTKMGWSGSSRISSCSLMESFIWNPGSAAVDPWIHLAAVTTIDHPIKSFGSIQGFGPNHLFPIPAYYLAKGQVTVGAIS